MKPKYLACILLLLALRPETVDAVRIPQEYCQIPPFLNNTVVRKPQIMVVQDNSGSMLFAAYAQAFEKGKSYYGMFDPDRCYLYDASSEYFQEASPAHADFSCPHTDEGEWSGSLLNWALMRRIDIARKVLIGGYVEDRKANEISLLGQPKTDNGGDTRGFTKTANLTNYSPLSGTKTFTISKTNNYASTSVMPTYIVAGGEHSCAVNELEELYCWGRNNAYQLGDGSKSDSATPNTVADGEPAAIWPSAGYDHTCAIDSTGGLLCWGENGDGQLGDGTTTDRSRPVPVLLSGMATPIKKVSAGYKTTCAIDANDDLFCWGDNEYGQLGLGHTSDVSKPQLVSTLKGVFAVSVGEQHVCAASRINVSQYTLFCWGRNHRGQLGDGTATTRTTPTSVAGFTALPLLGTTNGIEFMPVAAGSHHTCAIKPKNTDPKAADVYCWGYNASRQLGDRTTTQRTSPVQVKRTGSANLTGYVQVAAGGIGGSGHSCAISYNNDIACWGNGSYGQVGNNSTSSSHHVNTGILSSAVLVSAGGYHTCAMRSNNDTYCWGRDTNGQVGNDNSKSNQRTPRTVHTGDGLTDANIRIAVRTSKGPEAARGVLHDLMDQAKLGIAYFKSNYNGGRVAIPIGKNGASIDDIVDSLESLIPDTNTPLAETLFTIVRYFRQDSDYYQDNTGKGYQFSNDTNNKWYDPWSDPCTNSFIMMITDGEPTQDSNLPSVIRSYDKKGQSFSHITDDYFDDVALYANSPRNDSGNSYDTPKDGFSSGHRHGKGIPVYTIFTFGDPKFVPFMERVGINGAFVDYDGNKVPYDNNGNLTTDEFDQNRDGNPDGFFYAEEGDQMEQAIRTAFSSVLQRTAAGTSISMVSTNRRGDGSIVQSYFRPVYSSGAIELSWLGMLQSLWIDEAGNVREDTNLNGKLDLKEDRIVVYHYNEESKETVAHLFKDADGNLRRDRLVPNVAEGDDTNVPLYKIRPIWEGGAELLGRPAATRKIITMHDANGDQIIDADEIGDFVPGATIGGESLRNLLVNPSHEGDGYGWSAADTAQLDLVASFTRGMPANSDATFGKDFRSRAVTNFPYKDGFVTGEWKLGDIMFSTPIVVGPPAERFDLNHRDRSYSKFFVQYANRKPLLYTGGNDGMLHIFNPGKYNPLKTDFSAEELGGVTGTNKLGHEIASIIPGKALAMLQYVASNNYGPRCHISYVDQPPRVADARVFNEDDRHPNGWGTLLIMQMRLGCHDETMSSVLILDITDPDALAANPENFVLAELVPEKLGFTYSFPAIVKVGQIDQGTPSKNEDQWFLVMGSGPTDLQSVTRQGDAYLHVWDLRAIASERKVIEEKLLVKDAATGYIEKDAFTSGILAIDSDMNYEVDALYFGTASNKFSDAAKPRWGGGVWRVNLGGENDPNRFTPSKWVISRVLDGDDGSSKAGRPFTEMPTAYLDPERIAAGKGATVYLTFVSGRFLSRLDPYDDLDYPCVGTIAPPCSGSRSFQVAVTLKDECLGNTACTKTYKTSDLVNTSAISVKPNGQLINTNTGAVHGTWPTFKLFNDYMANPSTRGWFKELGNSPGTANDENRERASGGVVFHGDSRGLYFSTYTPGRASSASCAATGDGKVYALYFRTGTANPDNPLLFGDQQKHPSEPKIADNHATVKDPYSTTVNRDTDCASCSENAVTGIPGVPATPAIHKNRLVIQDNNANLMTLSRGIGPRADKGFILWRIL